MKKIGSITMLALTVFCASATFACEPQALNWDQFYAINDKNNDKKIQRSEWQNLNFKGSNYDAGFESSLSPAQIFQELDKNKNGSIEGEEIYDLYRYLNNPCAGFDMRNSTQSKSVGWFPLHKLKKILNDFFD